MNVVDKLQEVSSNAVEGRLILYLEGMFWKAYQEAAYLFVKYIRNFQVNGNYVKKVQADVLSLGFPKPSVKKILGGLTYEESAKTILISLSPNAFVMADYLQWRSDVVPQSIPLSKPSSDTLLVYKHTYNLVLYFYQINRNISREYKFSICEKIKEDLHEMLMTVYFANENDDLSSVCELLKEATRLLASAKIRMRLIYDLKQISLKQFTHCAESFSSLKNELHRWESSLLCSR